MITALRERVLPPHQRRTLEELTDDLDLSVGDVASKRSAYWTMLLLSAVIATAGVLDDSTATVIGAMIIAPLSTPIMGIALAGVLGRNTHAIRYVVLGGTLVVGVGLLLSFLLPEHYDLLSNSQISSRTSPSMVDLLAAMATGLAGSVGLARRDVSAVLPGVAIAISLVPPLAVAGVCLGRLDLELALGATLLFVSNLLALVIAGTVTFAALGYANPSLVRPGRNRRQLTVALVLLAVVTVPLAVNTVLTYLLIGWRADIHEAARSWASTHPGVEVVSVDFRSATANVEVLARRDVPPVQDLLDDLRGVVPDRIDVVVDVTRGYEIDGGAVGGD